VIPITLTVSENPNHLGPVMKQHPLLLIGGFACALLLQSSPAVGQSRSARDSVVSVVHEFFRSMAQRDSAGLRATITPDAAAWAVASGGNRSPTARPLADFPASLLRQDALLERMWQPTVLVHKETAVVWAPYDFHINGRFSHCGVDAFSLVRGEDRWRIAAITYTVERQGCAASPLGPPR
jgi:hypothetical protein